MAEALGHGWPGLPRVFALGVSGAHSYQLVLWLERLADWFGYRYMSFDAGVLVQDGKVSQAEYGLANEWIRPKFPGYVGFWLPRPMGLAVTKHFGCDLHQRCSSRTNQTRLPSSTDAMTLATLPPEIWRDAQTIQQATYQQLISEKCPNSIIEGRMRYLPDISVLLLEVTGSRRIDVNEEGGRAEDWFTDYKLKEVIQGQTFGSWKNVRFQRTIPSPKDPTRQITNQIWPSTKIGSQVLFFGGLGFYSCRFIPATPSALEIVRNTPVPMKRPEDQIPRGLQ